MIGIYPILELYANRISDAEFGILGNALSTLGERESGTARLVVAVAAFDACLTVTERVWPEEWVQEVRTPRDETQTEINRRRATK